MKKLKYLFLIMLSTFMSVSFVNAEVESFQPRFVGYTLDDEFIIDKNSSWSGPINFISTQPIDSNFAYVDVCTTGYEPTLWITPTGDAQISPSTNWYKLNIPCNTGGYKADVYRQIMYISSSDFGSCGEFGRCYSVTATGRLFNNTPEYATSIRILHIGLSNDIPLNDIILENDKTQTDLLRDILNSLSNNDTTMQDVLESNQAIKEQTEKLNQETEKLNQNITNDNVGGVENSFESFESFISENSTITQLITMPITLYSSILNGLQSSCQSFVLGKLFGTNLTLPCINIGSYLGSTLWSMIDIIISGFAIFSISKKLIKIFNNFSSMKEGDVIDD